MGCSGGTTPRARDGGSRRDWGSAALSKAHGPALALTCSCLIPPFLTSPCNTHLASPAGLSPDLDTCSFHLACQLPGLSRLTPPCSNQIFAQSGSLILSSHPFFPPHPVLSLVMVIITVEMNLFIYLFIYPPVELLLAPFLLISAGSNRSCLVLRYLLLRYRGRTRAGDALGFP